MVKHHWPWNAYRRYPRVKVTNATNYFPSNALFYAELSIYRKLSKMCNVIPKKYQVPDTYLQGTGSRSFDRKNSNLLSWMMKNQDKRKIIQKKRRFMLLFLSFYLLFLQFFILSSYFFWGVGGLQVTTIKDLESFLWSLSFTGDVNKGRKQIKIESPFPLASPSVLHYYLYCLFIFISAPEKPSIPCLERRLKVSCRIRTTGVMRPGGRKFYLVNSYF